MQYQDLFFIILNQFINDFLSSSHWLLKIKNSTFKTGMQNNFSNKRANFISKLNKFALEKPWILKGYLQTYFLTTFWRQSIYSLPRLNLIY